MAFINKLAGKSTFAILFIFYFGELRAPYLLNEDNPANFPILKIRSSLKHILRQKNPFWISYQKNSQFFVDKERMIIKDSWDRIYNPFIYSIYQSSIDSDETEASKIKKYMKKM